MILICYGTRPEFIKVKPIIDGLKNSNISFRTLFTGQHKDIIQNDYKPDHQVEIKDGVNRLDSVLGSCLNLPESFFKDITHILVQGDTTSVLSLAICGMHRQIKIIHLEAGLRTYDFDNPYPEEANRQLVSRITDIHLCPTQNNKDILEKEGVKGEKYVVGNTVLDNLVEYKDKCSYNNKVLITLHRRENHDKIIEWFTEIDRIASENPETEFILPIHPNPNVRKHKGLLKNINIIEPMNHKELLNLLTEVKLVISDSGGIQEECSFLNKKVIVCRTVTERPESVGTHSFMCAEPSDLYTLFYNMKDEYEVDEPCPYGDGRSVEKILKILSNL